MLVAIPELPERAGSPSDPKVSSPTPGTSADPDDWRMQQADHDGSTLNTPAPMVIGAFFQPFFKD
jgi:hypothetical protein